MNKQITLPAMTGELSGANILLKPSGMPVSQKQVRQREQHMQFGALFSQTSVSCLAIPE